MSEQLRIIISGGGTGGHIFPAVSIAREIQARYPQARILFVGAEGRMEMERVPAAGFPIEGIRIAGFQRKKLFANLGLPVKIWLSLKRVRAILERERPHLVVGTGGYVSGPTLWVAQRMGIPTLIQEQNSFAGWTNRLLSKKAGAVCVAYPGMESAFPADRIKLTGNPIRPDLAALAHLPTTAALRAEAKVALGYDPLKPLVLILGGSQGARAINEGVAACENMWRSSDIQIFWQCGRYYAQELIDRFGQGRGRIISAFIDDMPAALRAADMVLSRAGAGTLSELACSGSAAVLVPSPNVAEDHQTHNAQSLVDSGAAVIMPEVNIHNLCGHVHGLLNRPDELELLRGNARKLAKPAAAQDIVNECERLWSWRK
jgi:UDP-N-acetylglucosamine--N-acetylmuramyl-(pentapeptide) pyrophosphoryl-undecaprenol N-acetylglucosamine transferase